MADAEITLTIPEAYVPKVIAMVDSFLDRDIRISTDDGLGADTVIKFPTVGGEGTVAKGKRFIEQFMRACLRMKAETDAKTDKRQQISAIVVVVEPVEPDIIT